MTGRPVKWIEDRREHLLATNHARDVACELEIACDRDGTILALRGHAKADVGAYIRTNGATGARNTAQILSGPYRVPNIHMRVSLVITNKTPVGTYRGPGRFEADFFRERLFDMAARDFGIDPVEFRRRNLIAEAEMPYPLARVVELDLSTETDSGDYRTTFARCLEEIGWAEKAPLQGTLVEGRYHGLAVGCYFEGGASGPRESARLVLEADGAVSVYVGSSANGQGLETVFAQIAADALEMPIGSHPRRLPRLDRLRARRLRQLRSRSVVMGGSAILDAAGKLRDAIREAAARRLGCAAADVVLGDGKAAAPGAGAVTLRRSRGRRNFRRGHLRERQAHLQLRRPRRPCRGRSAHRRRRGARLCRGGGCRPHHQSGDAAWPGGRRDRAGSRRRVPGASRL